MNMSYFNDRLSDGVVLPPVEHACMHGLKCSLESFYDNPDHTSHNTGLLYHLIVEEGAHSRGILRFMVQSNLKSNNPCRGNIHSG